MSDQTFSGNPFDPATFTKGGGLWDGKVVTIITAKANIDRLSYGDGSPVLDAKTGEQSIRNVIEIVGIADDEEKERRETYSAGSLVPTADGEGFLRRNPDGSLVAAPFHENSEAAKFSAALASGGFPVAKLWDEKAKRTKLSMLAGARLLMKAEAKLDKDGNAKKNKKGYDQQKFFPIEFLGYKGGGNGNVASSTSAPQGNGSALRDKAIGVVTTLLAENGGTLTRSDLVRKLSAALNGDADCNKVLALVVREEFHKDAPWTRQGTTLTL
jgi:hypothetical protein